MVADNSITGSVTGSFSSAQIAYFKRIKKMNLSSPILIGFGIKTSEQYSLVNKYANGAIIGSEFMRKLSTHGALRGDEPIKKFIGSIINR